MRKYIVYAIYQYGQHPKVPPIIFSRKEDALACAEKGDKVVKVEMQIHPFYGYGDRKRFNAPFDHTIPT